MGEPRTGVDDAVIDEATRWFALLRSEAATEDDRRAFEVWRSADPRHASAYERTLSIWEDIGELRDLKELAPAPGLVRPRRPSRRVFAYAALATAVGLAVILPAIIDAQPAWLLPNVHATRIAETAQIALPDGSVAELAPKSKVRIAYSGDERRVFLQSGEAFFDVRKGDRRAFVVVSGQTEVRVTGTKFNVRQGPTGVTIAVAEGAVELRRKVDADQTAAHGSGALTLTAGQQAAAPKEGNSFSEILETASAKVGAWRTGHLQYADATLRDIIADANRYSRVPIVVADEGLLDMKLVAAFHADQIDSMIDGLPEILPLEVDRSSIARIVLRTRDATN